MRVRLRLVAKHARTSADCWRVSEPNAPDPQTCYGAETRAWTGVVTGERRSAAIAVACEVAARASDPACIAAALATAPQQSIAPETLQWEPFGIAQGDAGLAVTCGYFDACLPEMGWDPVARDFLTVAVRGAERRSGIPAGLFGGLAGLTFATANLSRGETRYRGLLASLDRALADRAVTLAAVLRFRDPLVDGDFDLISGAVGVGACLLDRDVHGVLPELLGGLVAVAAPRAGAPRWATESRQLGNDAMARQYPSGILNCGLAHGVPGPLALLALALDAGVEVAGQAEAVRRTADWLMARQVDDAWGPNWPMFVPLTESGAPGSETERLETSRSGWCYGSPGVARALWFAGTVLREAELRDLAVETMHAVVRRPRAQRRLQSPTFCHGVAGLLQIFLRFAHDTGEPAFAEAAAELTDELLAAYEPRGLLGFSSVESGGNRVDRAGLLDGAPGGAMALLAAATDAEPSWDRLFLLS